MIPFIMGSVFEEGRRVKVVVLLLVLSFVVVSLVALLSFSQQADVSGSGFVPFTGQVVANQDNVAGDDNGNLNPFLVDPNVQPPINDNDNDDGNDDVVDGIIPSQDQSLLDEFLDALDSLTFENAAPEESESDSDDDSSSVGSGLRYGLPFSLGEFSGGTTDWTSYPDLSQVCGGDAVLEIPGIGRIQWDGCVDVRFAQFHKYIRIVDGEIFVDSDSLHNSFNSSAQLTMHGLDFDYTPAIYRNGDLCSSSQCQMLNYQNGVATFSVSSFSSYTLGANSRLDIWDETDPATFPHAGLTKFPDENVSFFADYVNITSGQNISTATCAINFTDSDAFMTYNSSKGRFEYTRNFTSAGAFEFNVSCSAVGFASLNTSDLVSIQTASADLQSVGPSGANFTVIGSQRGPVSPPDANGAFAGNVTLGLVDGGTITQSWQGYYGNVSGTITLSNSAGSVLYNWSSTSPSGEVYASRSSGVNFANISCASTSHIVNEQNSLGQEASDYDSFQNTFNVTSHPQFFAGTTDIAANSCNSTNLFNTTGAQSSSFYEVLLSDNSANIVYTAILEQNVIGFDNDRYDFEMIVAEDGHDGDTATTSYYFYVELQ